ncbi:bifunctional 5,10-methylenetetrahydrofolate dehydrogenase/5,10-methenyltetrahydrofolate cyclohydrolase [Halobaculum sp. MBLA0143]|uniref:bifunctional 5,10-methylenetetrahydrofolate dehydrogenase/5,10-methenyltetrahydrofolate cyclohydrolase n=1 Tax=Halobaculum sp. MBLA0143 TaxID=3079933 RepID=UPI003525BEC4
MTQIIDGEALAGEIREGVADAVAAFESEGVTPGLATVLMEADPASETYVNMKQRDCEEVGIDGIHVEVDADAPEAALFDRIDELNDDDGVHGILVQMPVPDHVDERAAQAAVDPAKDVDGFNPENVGRLVAGEPRFRPCTPFGIQRLLADAGVETAGADVVVVGRSNIVGRPLANLLTRRADDGNATVTICHSKTADLAAHTRRADVVVAAAGVPELIGREEVTPETTVVDVGINRVERDGESTLVGDADFEALDGYVDAITPVPGGVGPMTRAMLLYNTVLAARRQTGLDVPLP